MSANERERSVLQAAQLYHLDGLTQAAVADRLGVTRWTVSRLLQEAVDRGIVKTRIEHPYARLPDLEERLKEKYGLVDARVVPSMKTRAETFVSVARTAADFLSNIRPQPAVVGVGWGKTTAAIARAMKQGWNPGVEVAQTNVAPAEVGELLASGPVRILAARGPGREFLLEGPTVAKTPAEAQAVMNEDGNRETLEKAASAEVYLYSPAALEEATLLVRGGGLKPAHVEALRAMGATGSVLCTFVNERGEPVSSELQVRTVGTPLANLRGDGTSIVTGYGTWKVPAFRAALNGGYANVLITDRKPAEGLLED